MQVVAISVVRNEIDVIEAFVRHTLAIVNRLVVLDNGSTDGTLAILRRLVMEGLPLEVVEDPSPGHFHAQRMNRLMHDHAVARWQADWILPLDADEMVVVPAEGSLLPEGVGNDRVITLPMRTYVPAETDDPGQLNPLLRICHRLVEEGCPWTKVLVPGSLAALPGATLVQGNHAMHIDGKACVQAPGGQTYLAHFPFRSPGHYLAKIALKSLQYETMPDRSAEWGWHYQAAYQLLKRDVPAFLSNFLTAARRFAQPIGARFTPKMVVDPLAYLGGALVYTPPVDDATRGWLAILHYAEQLARSYGMLQASVTPDGRYCPEQTGRLVAGLHAQLADQNDRLVNLQAGLTRQDHLLRKHDKQFARTGQRIQELERALCLAQQQRQMAEVRLLHETRRLEDGLRGSWTWKVGRLVVGPLSYSKRIWRRQVHRRAEAMAA